MNYTLSPSFRPEIKDYAIVKAEGGPQPDDLDLKGMARAALNYLRGNPDPQRNYECKFALGPLGIPFHVPISPSNEYGYDVVSLGDTDSRMDTQYAHMREMAGEPTPDEVELGVRRRVMGYQREDHLSWVNPGAAIGETISGEWVSTWATAKLMCSLSEDYQRTGEAKLKKKARRMLLALKKIALWDDNRAFYWGVAPYKDGEWLLRNWCNYHGRNYPFIVEPCVCYYECTGDEEGLELARSFADGFLDEVQPEMGSQRVNPDTGEFTGHIHLHTHAIWGVAHLGAAVGEKRYLNWARKAHDFVLSLGTDYGWYPEFAPQGEYRTEICVVGDMVSLGAWLARGGRPEYWDVVERTVRNLLRRSQFSLTPAFVKLFEEVHQDKPKEVVEQALRDLRRIEGGFVAQASFDDWVSYPGKPKLGSPGLSQNGIQMMGCCPPEGMRALWEAWNGIVERWGKGTYVNLAISRDHDLAKVVAFRPEDGGMEVTAKAAGDYFLRPPAWSDRAGWVLTRNGTPAPVRWGGPAQAYVVCAGVSPGEKLSLTWPVPRYKQVFSPRSVPGRDGKITVHWVGSKVVGVEPKGQYLPMFE